MELVVLVTRFHSRFYQKCMPRTWTLFGWLGKGQVKGME
jgi:hypothetical protein